MSSENTIDPAVRRRNRIMLVALALIFLLPVGAATLLHSIGYRPDNTKNHGILIEPPVSLSDVVLHQMDGSPYPWAPFDRRWHVAIVPPSECVEACQELIAGLDKVWRLQGRRADRLNVLWFGEVPQDVALFRTFIPMKVDAEVAARLPQLATDGSPNAYLIDPSGFIVMRYEPGFDVADLRADITHLLK